MYRFLRRSPLMFAFTLPFLAPAGDPPAGDPAPATPPAADPDEVKFDEKQQAKLNAIVAAEKKAEAQRVEAALKAAAEAAEQKAKEEREREEATKRGEFDSVKASLEKERDSVASERDTLKGQVEFLTKHFEDQFAQRAEAVDKSFALFKPADDAPLAERLDWLTKAEQGTAELNKDKPGTPAATPPRGSAAAPKPAGSATTTDEDTKAKARMRPKM